MLTIDPFQVFSPEDVLRIGVALVVLFSALISILFVIWWGFLMIISGGDEEKVKKAVNRIRYAIIGVGFIILVLFVLPTFFDLLGMPYGDYLRPNAILGSLGHLSNVVFGTPIQPIFPGQIQTTVTDDFTQLP